MRLSILDPTLVADGCSIADALAGSLDLARHAEKLGYHRYWLAEHHNMPGIASAATAVVIGHIAGGTSRIRVGAGGVMLPNHSPMVIAEQFGTLEALYPGRIDLGLGRAPGTDQRTLRALRRDPASSERFPQDVVELQALLGPVQPGQAVQAVPGGGSQVPLWILGSSLFGAELAAILGLPYAYASNFAPDALLPALERYRRNFRPSAQLERPYAMASINVFAADTDAEGKRLFTSLQQSMTNMLRGRPVKVPAAIDDIESYWTPHEKAQVSHMLTYAVAGSPDTIRKGLQDFVRLTGVNEVMTVSGIADHGARLRSCEIAAQVAADIEAG